MTHSYQIYMWNWIQRCSRGSTQWRTLSMLLLHARLNITERFWGGGWWQLVEALDGKSCEIVHQWMSPSASMSRQVRECGEDWLRQVVGHGGRDDDQIDSGERELWIKKQIDFGGTTNEGECTCTIFNDKGPHMYISPSSMVGRLTSLSSPAFYVSQLQLWRRQG